MCTNAIAVQFDARFRPMPVYSQGYMAPGQGYVQAAQPPTQLPSHSASASDGNGGAFAVHQNMNPGFPSYSSTQPAGRNDESSFVFGPKSIVRHQQRSQQRNLRSRRLYGNTQEPSHHHMSQQSASYMNFPAGYGPAYGGRHQMDFSAQFTQHPTRHPVRKSEPTQAASLPQAGFPPQQVQQPFIYGMVMDLDTSAPAPALAHGWQQPALAAHPSPTDSTHTADSWTSSSSCGSGRSLLHPTPGRYSTPPSAASSPPTALDLLQRGGPKTLSPYSIAPVTPVSCKRRQYDGPGRNSAEPNDGRSLFAIASVTSNGSAEPEPFMVRHSCLSILQESPSPSVSAASSPESPPLSPRIAPACMMNGFGPTIPMHMMSTMGGYQ